MSRVPLVVTIMAVARMAFGGITVEPSSGPISGGNMVVITGQLENQCRTTCAGSPVVKFGATAAKIVSIDGDTAVTVEAPPHTAGLVDVTYFSVIGETTVAERAYRYGSSEDPTFKRILIPLSIKEPGTPGAYGSVWVTHLLAFNASSSDKRLASDPGACSPCSDELPAHSVTEVDVANAGAGRFIYAETTEGAEWTFSLRAQDTSRQALTWGTELPLVNADVPLTGRSSILIGVPLDERFRQTIRIYELDARPADVLVRVFDAANRTLLADRTVRLAPGSFGASGLPGTPGYAQLNSLRTEVPELAHSTEKFVNLIITPLDRANRIWAFASITNNETQHVTIIHEQP